MEKEKWKASSHGRQMALSEVFMYFFWFFRSYPRLESICLSLIFIKKKFLRKFSLIKTNSLMHMLHVHYSLEHFPKIFIYQNPKNMKLFIFLAFLNLIITFSTNFKKDTVYLFFFLIVIPFFIVVKNIIKPEISQFFNF